MARIARLSNDLINKIAAGEVVERPASVVKELVENSLDAGARTVQVSLEGGGLQRIVISDDGHGMGREDALLCLERHATSKLRELDDLQTLDSKGFRGEALPAIAAVSRFTLHTAEPGAEVGTRVTVEGGSPPQVEDAPPRVGTVMTVEDLFYNTPARLKFMRRSETELKHVEEAVIRIALAHPEVSFLVEHGGLPLFTSPACADDPTERIAAALGTDVHPHLFPVEELRLGVSVTGHVASPEYTLPTARGIYTFVNHRYVRDRGLIGAIQRAYQEYLPSGRQPLVVLFIDVEPHTVDVNVHPQKLEVRFSDSRGVYDAVLAGIVRTLRAAPWLGPAPQEAEPQRQAAHYAQAVERFLTRAQEASWGAPLPLPSAADAPSLGRHCSRCPVRAHGPGALLRTGAASAQRGPATRLLRRAAAHGRARWPLPRVRGPRWHPGGVGSARGAGADAADGLPPRTGGGQGTGALAFRHHGGSGGARGARAHRRPGGADGAGLRHRALRRHQLRAQGGAARPGGRGSARRCWRRWPRRCRLPAPRWTRWGWPRPCA